jgi:glutaredoxin
MNQNLNHICKRCATATNPNLEIQQIKAKLYSTEFCHLCEEAKEIIRKAGITATIIDIVEDKNLFEKYSTRIPVLQRIDNEAELGWPFDTVAVSRFLAQRRCQSLV